MRSATTSNGATPPDPKHRRNHTYSNTASHTTDLVSALGTLQIKGATEAIARWLQRELKADPSLCVLQVDVGEGILLAPGRKLSTPTAQLKR